MAGQRGNYRINGSGFQAFASISHSLPPSVPVFLLSPSHLAPSSYLSCPDLYHGKTELCTLKQQNCFFLEAIELMWSINIPPPQPMYSTVCISQEFRDPSELRSEGGIFLSLYFGNSPSMHWSQLSNILNGKLEYLDRVFSPFPYLACR